MLNWFRITVRMGLAVVIVMALVLGSGYKATQVLAATSPTLGAALTYSVLAGSIVTNTGTTTVAGDLGVSPSIGIPPHVTGAPTVGPPGTIHDADAHAALAQGADTAVFGFIDQTPTTTYLGVTDLTTVSPLGPGVYYAPSGFRLTGNLNLSGSGVWIFKSGSDLITSPGSSVTGGDPCNVWWRVGSSATLDTTTHFIGNILALTDINLRTGATLNGRALAQTGQVTLQSNVITTPLCGAATSPHLTLLKSVTPAIYTAAGNVLTYTLFATNDGNSTLTNVFINDPGLNITNAGGQPVTLLPGATLTVTGTRTVASGDVSSGSLSNTATVSAAGGTAASASVTAFKQQLGIPHLSLTKTVSPTTFSKVGDVLTYTLVATNDGTENLDNVTISDAGLNNIVSTPAGPLPLTLIPGATLTVVGTRTIVQADLDHGSISNTASAEADVAGTEGEETVLANATTSSTRRVGGEISAINPATVLVPWLVVGLVLLLGGTGLVLLRRRRTSR